MMKVEYASAGNAYIACMKEIVERINYIKEYLENINNLKNKSLALESICLQYRKIFELIAISTIVANQRQFTLQNKKLLKEWHPETIIKGIKKINPHYFPIPVINETIYGVVLCRFKKIDSTSLSESELISAWKSCSNHLHTRSPFDKKLDEHSILNNFQTWWDKIQGLLYTHSVRLETFTSYLIADVDFSKKNPINVSFIELINSRIL